MAGVASARSLEGSKPPRIRDRCKGMSAAARLAFFAAPIYAADGKTVLDPGGEGRELYPKHVCDEQVRTAVSNREQAERRRSALQTFIDDECDGKDSPSNRRRFFCSSPKAIEGYGAKQRKAEAERLVTEYGRLCDESPSPGWVKAADEDAEEFPPGKAEAEHRSPKPRDRRGATTRGTRMILSAVSGRYTPPHNLSDEDGLDAMSPGEALAYEAPGSCGSVVGARYL